MKPRSINRNIRRNRGRVISQVIRRKENFVVMFGRPFYLNKGWICSPFDEDLLFISNYISMNDYFKYFKKLEGSTGDLCVSEIFNNFMKNEYVKTPEKYIVEIS